MPKLKKILFLRRAQLLDLPNQAHQYQQANLQRVEKERKAKVLKVKKQKAKAHQNQKRK